jgi:predicted Zn-dependent protease with MMP-like domain
MVFGLWTALGGHGAPGIELAHNVRTPEDVGALLVAAEHAGGTIIRPPRRHTQAPLPRPSSSAALGAIRCEAIPARAECCGPVALDNGLVIEVEPGRFEDMVVTALDGLPEELGQLMRNVAVTVEHRPGPPGLLGLYEGIPLTSRTSQYAGVLPDRITIYRQAICAICRTEQEVDDQVRRTVIHEIAHHFGIDDNRLRELGW